MTQHNDIKGLYLLENFIENKELLSMLTTKLQNCKITSTTNKHLKSDACVALFEFGWATSYMQRIKRIPKIPSDYVVPPKWLALLWNHAVICLSTVKELSQISSYDEMYGLSYEPTQIIPDHTDDKIYWKNSIVVLSFGAGITIDFKRNDVKHEVWIPANSMYVMTGEARYEWTHGIRGLNSDVVNGENGGGTMNAYIITHS